MQLEPADAAGWTCLHFAFCYDEGETVKLCSISCSTCEHHFVSLNGPAFSPLFFGAVGASGCCRLNVPALPACHDEGETVKLCSISCPKCEHHFVSLNVPAFFVVLCSSCSQRMLRARACTSLSITMRERSWSFYCTGRRPINQNHRLPTLCPTHCNFLCSWSQRMRDGRACTLLSITMRVRSWSSYCTDVQPIN